MLMPTPAPPARTVDITAAPRAVITFASELVSRVFGERLTTARENAWQAVLADRERAAARDELDAVVRDARATR
jgi:hypothetical protein